MAAIEEVLQPSMFGFRNMKPRSRRERKAANDKTATEKLRLEARVGWEARMHRANAPETTSGLTSCTPIGAGYINNSDRFHTDTVGEEKEIRQQMMVKKQNIIEYHRQVSTMREDEKAKYNEMVKRKEDEHAVWLQNQSSSVLKNSSGASYNITNQNYLNTPAGIEQQKIDEMVKYRAQLRAHNLAGNADSRVSYNILNGESRRDPPPIPPAVVGPKPTYTSNSVKTTPWSTWEERRGQNPYRAPS